MLKSALSMRAEQRIMPPQKIIHMLLVEDCASDVVLMQHMLDNVSPQCNYHICSVPRLVDAFSAVESGDAPFDIIMLDLNLLDIDGVAPVAALHAEAPEIPIIVYSGLDDNRIKEEAYMCGAAQYLVKGRESAYGLHCVIENILEKQKAEPVS